MTNYDLLLTTVQQKLNKALAHLEYSYQKVMSLSTDVPTMSEDALATWESFSARFARLTDLILSRYIRTVVLRSDPGFQGNFRDFLYQAEKLGYLTNSNRWLGLRELRNITLYECNDSDLAEFFIRLLNDAPFLITETTDCIFRKE